MSLLETNVIEAAVCLGLVALGVGAWLFVRLARGIYGRPGRGRDDSMMARLFSDDAPRGHDS